MTHSPKFDRRTMLSADPKSFNELLDLFAAYVSTFGGPIHKGHDMLREEIGAGEHTALGHIFGVACDAEDMARQLKKIRAEHNQGRIVSLCLDLGSARIAHQTIGDTIALVADTETALRVVQRAIGTDDLRHEYEAQALAAMTRRALTAAEDQDMPQLRKLAKALHAAMAKNTGEQEAAA